MSERFSDVRFAIIRFNCLVACGFKPAMVTGVGYWYVTH